jgi:MFS family permease
MSYSAMVLPFILCGIGMALFFVPVASVVMGSVPTAAQGVASGTNNGIRELGGVLGISVLGAIFSAQGSLASPQSFLDGVKPAVVVGALMLAAGGVAALALPGRRSRTVNADQSTAVPVQSAAAVPVEV